MKKIITLLNVMIFSVALLAQQVPQGMKYQAVARNLKGEILADEQIVLRISLTSLQNNTVVTHYSEMHNVKTNELGLFNLVIGEGTSSKSAFKNIPWSSQNIWMEVAIADKAKGGFTVISSSKLLAVPYAFHAETANKISGNNNFRDVSSGTTSGNSWNTVGNLKTNSLTDYLGTADNTDFIIKTNGQERLRFTKEGKLITPNGVGLELGGNLQVKGDSVKMDKDLYVGRNVVLNYLPWDLAPGTTPSGAPIPGNTINRGNFTVSDMSSTSLTGSLTVDKLVRFNDATQSTSATSGALVVTGGTGIGKNLNVGGTFSVLGDVSVNTNKFNITASNGNSTIAGTLGVTGNVAVNTNKFYIDASNGNSTIAGTLGVAGNVAVNTNKFNIDASNGNTGIAGTLGVTGNVAVNTNKFNIDASNGNTTIAGITTLNNSIFANGQLKINKALAGTGDDVYANYPLQVEGSHQGIAIKLISTPYDNPTEQNNFISFLNSTGGFRGRIEGHPGGFAAIKNLADDLVNSLDIDFDGEEEDEDPSEAGYPTAQQPAGADQIFTSNAAIEGYERSVDFFASVIRFATNLGAAAILCVGGDCDDVIWSAIDMGVDAAELATFLVLDEVQAGVSYESGGADYAEWLPKFYPEESLSYGEVVGIKGGIISKTFKEADKFMVVSFAPAVIGGMPDMSVENSYEKIAFMGQVMVKVMGTVNKGDYILPAGNGDGFAIAIAPDKMQALDYKRVIGVAWGESDGKELFKYIKTAVGINTNDMAGMIDNMQSVMNKMQEAIKKITPDYQPSYFSVNGSYVQTKSGYSTMPSVNQQLKTKVGSVEEGQEMMIKLKEVQSTLKEQGVDLSKYKLIDNCLNNPTKENAQLLADRATKVLNKLQANYMAAQQARQSK